jgi:mannitol-1-phosphate 5-dehydrogenase
MYGAGNIGRGFIGQIFVQSGYELIFIDVDNNLVETINRERCYPIRILDNEKTEDILIKGVSAINGNNKEKVIQVIVEADIMATAVGTTVLPYIAPIITDGLKKRFTQNPKPLNIIICENLIDADKILTNLIINKLTNDEKFIFKKTIGLVTSSIGRMVPLQTLQMQDGNPLRVCVEPYGLLPVDKAAFKGEIPLLKGLYPFDNFDFYIQRKLFVHNMGHGICAYLGMIYGYNFIYEAVNNKNIFFISKRAMLESAYALSKKYNESFAELKNHVMDLLMRFSNIALGDTCARVGVDTIRKLGTNDRFIGALRICDEQGISNAFISIGASAALYCHLKENGIYQNLNTAREEIKRVSNCGEETAGKILQYYSILITSLQSGDFDTTINKIIKTASD